MQSGPHKRVHNPLVPFVWASSSPKAKEKRIQNWFPFIQNDPSVPLDNNHNLSKRLADSETRATSEALFWCIGPSLREIGGDFSHGVVHEKISRRNESVDSRIDWNWFGALSSESTICAIYSHHRRGWNVLAYRSSAWFDWNSDACPKDERDIARKWVWHSMCVWDKKKRMCSCKNI